MAFDTKTTDSPEGSQERQTLLQPEDVAFLLAESQQGVYVSDSRGTVQFANPALLAWTGASCLVGEPVQAFLERVGLDAELISKSGQRRQVRIARRLLPDGSELGIVTDMSISGSLGTALVEEMRRMTRLAEEDPVTGLLNRRAFNEGLRRLEESSGGDYGVIVVDMDQFKKINDTHGHVAGDAALKIFAERLRQSLRGHDLLARFGGDEFAALLPEIGEGDLIETAERLRHVLKVEAIVEGTALHLDATLGYAHATPNPHTVFKRADASMYRAKRRKKQLARAAALSPETSPGSAESLPA